MASDVFRQWWQPGHPGVMAFGDIDQSVLDQLRQHANRAPLPLILTAAVIAAMVAQSMAPVWPWLWFSVVSAFLVYRSNRIVQLAQDQNCPSDERLRKSERLMLVGALLYALCNTFFPFADDTSRFILTIALYGVAISGVISLQGYPRLFYVFAIPNMGGACLGWLFSTPQHTSYWTHLALVGLTLLLLVFLIGLSRDTYRNFSTVQHMTAELQTALVAVQKAQETKSFFLASASHDLKQPLQSIGVISHELATGGKSPAEIGEAAETIDKCVSMLSDEISRLLELSNLESEAVVTRRVLVNVATVVENLVEQFAPVAFEKGISLIVDNQHDAVVSVDPVLLNRCLRNLLDNALKYTHEGSVQIRIQKSGSSVFIDITDTGNGISEKDQSRIFNEFYQVDNSERDRRKGVGLGLSVVKRILPLIDAEISVESTINSGSRFRLVLAVVNASINGKPETPLSGKHILLIEDDELVREATRALLKTWDVSVGVATDWASAIAAVETSKPDLLITDIRLPAESGLEIADRLKGMYADLPVIIVSGDSFSSQSEQAVNAGFRVLSKPVSGAILSREISAALG